MKTTLFAMALSLVASVPASALTVLPSSYSMANGSGLGSTYFDDSYNGSGCVVCDGAALSGGLGDLTNGQIATSGWDVVEPPPGPGPYVGWVNFNPTISFHFNQPVTINSVTFSFDDSLSGGVVAPANVVIAGQMYAVVNPPGASPFNYTVSGLNFVGTDLPITINRGGTSAVTMLSEVSFASAVPEPGSGALMLAGLLIGTGIAVRRRSAEPALG